MQQSGIFSSPDQQPRRCARTIASRTKGTGRHCTNIASPADIYCDKHRKILETCREKKRKSPLIRRESSCIPRLPSGELRCRRLGRKTWQCPLKATSPAGLYCHKHELERQIANEKHRKGNPRTNLALRVLLSLNPTNTSRASSSTNKVTSKGPKKQTPAAAAGRKCRRWRCDNIASPGIYCHTHQLETKTSTAVAAVKSARLGARKRLRNKQTVSAEKELKKKKKKCRGVSSLIDNDHQESRCASSDNEPTCEPDVENDDHLQNAMDEEQDDGSWSDHNLYEELQENQVLSFVNNGAMNAVHFSSEQMEVENDIMEVLTGDQSTVYLGDILIPAEYQQIYKEIKDLHGPLENGESVCEERRLSRETLVELLKVAHEVRGLTMESMTETTISNFQRTVAVGKLFNYNVGWLDENLKHLSDVYAKCCAVDGELEQVEKEITEKKHEEDILQLEVDEIDENIRVLEESINKMKQNQEMVEMEKKKKESNVSSLEDMILETSERICDTSREFYRIAAMPW